MHLWKRKSSRTPPFGKETPCSSLPLFGQGCFAANRTTSIPKKLRHGASGPMRTEIKTPLVCRVLMLAFGHTNLDLTRVVAEQHPNRELPGIPFKSSKIGVPLIEPDFAKAELFENLQHKSVGFLAPVFLIKGTNTNNDRLTTPCHSDLSPVRLQVKNLACSLPFPKCSPKKLGNESNFTLQHLQTAKANPFACLFPKPLKPTNFHRVCQRRVCNPRHLPRNAQDLLR